MKILIVGGVAGGASAAARIRRLDEKAEIIMFDKGPHVSFSNCGLPYHMSGEIKNSEQLILMTPEKFAQQYNIEARTNSEVIKIEPEKKVIHIKNHLTNEVYKEDYDKLVLSPGAEAIVPPFKGLNKIPNYTLKTVTDVEKIMKNINDNNYQNITVIGGGFIGVEVAENLIKAGKNVTLIEGSNQVIQPLDIEMAGFLHLELIKNKVNLILNKMVEGFDYNEVLLNDGQKIKSDLVILSIGVKPDTKFINDSGIELNERGYLIVNEQYQTNYQDVYAAGDAILVQHKLINNNAPLALAGPANKQGRLIADSIYGKKILNQGYIGSSIIKVFELTAASTGLNEKQAKENNIEYQVAYAAPTDKVSIMPNTNPMPIKILFNKDGNVLGAQSVAIGNVDKRIDVLATAIKANMNVYDLADLELCYAPPFSTGKDVVNKIGYIATNLLEGAYQQVPFTEVYDLIEQNKQVIDVREPGEYEKGHIKGVKNIPMSQLRARIDELDKKEKVYIHCQTGQRSYNMTIMLQSYGFDVYNIAGGYYFIKNYEQAIKITDKNRKNILV